MGHGVTGAAFLAVGCALADARNPGFTVGAPEFTAPPASGEPNLYATGDGRVVMTWFERTGDQRHALLVAVRTGGAWSAPRTVVEGDLFFVNWADFPSVLELPDGTWVTHWLQKAAPSTYAYHVKVAMSTDQGATWSAPVTPHRDTSPTEHGFVSMVPWGNGTGLIWLDGRAMAAGGTPTQGDHGMPRGAMTVRFTSIGVDGSLGEDVLLDDRTCECCQTALARTTNGLVAAYRDRSEAEIRNIAVTRLVSGQWTPPVPVADDQWHYPGCPVNGPSLSSAGDTVAIAWYTAPEQQPRAYVAFSPDAGKTWSAPIRVDDGKPLGRVDIELLADGSALVSWLEATSAAEVRARRVRWDGTVERSWLVTATSESRASGFPRMARVGNDVVFAWTEIGDAGGVRVATAKP
ncbi:MAG TPA: sialidase family protein [Gemmatimonadales bacterium]